MAADKAIKGVVSQRNHRTLKTKIPAFPGVWNNLGTPKAKMDGPDEGRTRDLGVISTTL